MFKQIYIKRRVKRPVSVFFLLSVFSLFSGCKTIPGPNQDNLASYVADSGDLVLFLNVKEDRSLSEYVLAGKGMENGLEEFLDRTDRICIALKGDGEVSAAAKGDYPYLVSNCMFSKDDSLVRHKDGYVWWSRVNGNEALSVPLKNLALYSNRDLIDELKRLKDYPSGGYGAENVQPVPGTQVYIYSENPSVDIFSLSGISGVNAEINRIDLFLVKEKDVTSGSLLYRMSGYIRFSDKKNAEVFNSAFKIGFLSFARKIGKDAVSDLIRGKRFFVEENRIVFDRLLINVPDLIKENRS